jgi:hypothetical protein
MIVQRRKKYPAKIDGSFCTTYVILKEQYLVRVSTISTFDKAQANAFSALVIQPGTPRPHLTSRLRGPRRQKATRTKSISFQQQLAESRNGLNTRRYPYERRDQIDDLSKKRTDQILRLENIIAEFVYLLAPNNGTPAYLQRMIELDAPGVLRRSSMSRSVNTTKASVQALNQDPVESGPIDLWTRAPSSRNSALAPIFDEFIDMNGAGPSQTNPLERTSVIDAGLFSDADVLRQQFISLLQQPWEGNYNFVSGNQAILDFT